MCIISTHSITTTLHLCLTGRVDKYGRQVAEDQAEGDLRRFYRLEDDDVERDEASAPKIVDYARGQVLLESSDEEDSEVQGEQDDSDDDGIVTLGRDASKPIPIPEDNFEINLDEEDLAELDAQAVAYAKANPEPESPAQIERTNRIAVVNLDWDHVRAIHLFKIFSSLVSPSAPPAASSSRTPGTSTSASTVKGKVLNVRVYPSQFGKERIATEDEEGPPPELFKKNHIENEEDINEKTIYETGDGEDYDEDALRNYQLERLRYELCMILAISVLTSRNIRLSGITMPSRNVTPSRPLRISILNWKALNLSGRRTSLTSVSCPMI